MAIFGIISLSFVVLSILGFCLETLPYLRPVNVTLAGNMTGKCEGKNITVNYVLQPNEILNILDIICTTFFTAELIVRFIFSPDKFRFIRNAMNIIDLLALVPLYMQLILNTDAFKFCYMNERVIFEIMFILRIIRMFRIFHLVKHYQALQILVYALKASIQELLMLLIFLLIGMLVFATMIYYAEREDAFNQGTQFSTIPLGFWWAIITMTTVGYGDIAPSTPLGYIVGTMCAICGVLMVALTIPVISNNFTLFYTHVRSRGGRRNSSEGLDKDLFLINHDDAKSIESMRRMSHGSLIPSEDMYVKRRLRHESERSTLAVNTGKFGQNGDVRYGFMACDVTIRHKSASSLNELVNINRDVAYFEDNETSTVKAFSDDGISHSDCHKKKTSFQLAQLCLCIEKCVDLQEKRMKIVRISRHPHFV
ncbi:potassium voltage-gated channel protein egl-36-like [Ruditapes philippinarum]|uniref:potassium voltage-gated channel protein egl-36-like n=1 Tax=Ruditapes philippinarum TaxID=129788 RepID=UPI00295AB5C7|nr:potassium voltage-gated channel protein egl-36-like [Ruditapes philippinarum]